MCGRGIELKFGRDNLARMERRGIPFFRHDDPRDPENYVFKGVSPRGRPVWLYRDVERSDIRIAIGKAQSNHLGCGGRTLILPGVVSDETIAGEPLQLRHVPGHPLWRDGRPASTRRCCGKARRRRSRCCPLRATICHAAIRVPARQSAARPREREGTMRDDLTHWRIDYVEESLAMFAVCAILLLLTAGGIGALALVDRLAGL